MHDNDQREHARAKDSILHPLPLDVVIDILQTADWSLETDEFLPVVRFSQVCRSWRSFAHSTPALWQKLTLTARKLNKRSMERELYLQKRIELTERQIVRDCMALSMYLERSQDARVELLIQQGYQVRRDTRETRPDYFKTFQSTFIPALVSLLRQCDTLIIKSAMCGDCILYKNDSPESSAFFDVVNNSQVLRTLIIRGHWEWGPRFSTQLTTKLSHLSFEYSHRFCKLDTFLPHGPIRVRKLELGDQPMAWAEFLRIACWFTNLEVLTLTVCEWEYFTVVTQSEVVVPADFPTVIISSLRELNIDVIFTNPRRAREPESTWRILELMDLPALELLQLEIAEPRQTLKLDPPVEGFFRRSPYLHTLEIISENPSVGKWITRIILPVTPNLKRLDVNYLHNNRDDMIGLIDGLAELRASPSVDAESNVSANALTPKLCPNLREFTLASEEIYPIPLKTMANFALARSTNDEQSNAAVTCKRQPFVAGFTFKDIGVGLENYLKYDDIASLCEGGRRFRLSVNKYRQEYLSTPVTRTPPPGNWAE